MLAAENGLGVFAVDSGLGVLVAESGLGKVGEADLAMCST